MNACKRVAWSVIALVAMTSAVHGAEPYETVFVSPNSVDWRPTPAEQATIERLTYQYFRAKDVGDYREAYLMIRPGIFEWERWREVSTNVNEKAGAVKSRRIKKITWYKDPPSGGAGVFAAVDFDSEFEKLEFHCGYVAWRQQPNGSFLLVREEQNLIERALAAKMDPDELRAVRAKFRC